MFSPILQCILELKANEEQCHKNVHNSTAIITALIQKIGYEMASKIVNKAKEEQTSVFETILNSEVVNLHELSELISFESVGRLGSG